MGYFNGPEGIAVNRTGCARLCYRSWKTTAFQKFTSDGKFLLKWGTKGSNRDGAFNGPEGIAVDAAGNVYVTDNSNYQVQKFDPGWEIHNPLGYLWNNGRKFYKSLGNCR